MSFLHQDHLLYNLRLRNSCYQKLCQKQPHTNYCENYQKEMQEKHKWVEYHKWKFKNRTYTALSGGNKCFVLSTRVEFGML